jgi:hypothetical protein
MVETAAHLAEHVISRLPVRQWVLSVPKRLRYFLHHDPDLQGAALRMFLGAVEQCLRAHSAGAGPAARLGAVAFILRFGSALNPYLHFHCVVLDGVFESTPTGGVVFHAATGLDAQAIAAVQATVRRRLLCSFARRGLLAGDDARDMAQWGHGGGFSAGLERLLRYDRRKSPFGTTEGSPLLGRPKEVPFRDCARPPLATERLQQRDAEHLIYEATKPGPGGRGPQILTPLQLIDRLAALVPPPRVHRHGR